MVGEEEAGDVVIPSPTSSANAEPSQAATPESTTPQVQHTLLSASLETDTKQQHMCQTVDKQDIFVYFLKQERTDGFVLLPC